MKLLSQPGREVSGVLLPIDADLPDADRVRWTARVLTVAERAEYREALAEAFGKPDAELESAVNDVIRRVATGWSNIVGDDDQPLPFTDDSLNRFTPEQRFVIARDLPEAAAWADANGKRDLRKN